MAQWAAGIILDVKTGEILGMTTKPDFDPNAAYEIADPWPTVFQQPFFTLPTI